MDDKSRNLDKLFITPEWYANEQRRRIESPRGKLVIASCRSGSYMAKKVVQRYTELLQENSSEEDVLYIEDIDKQFSDTETGVRLEKHVGGYDIFLFQALSDPVSGRSVDQNYMAFLIAARTFREHGANHITAMLPYLAYARQDKPTRYMREPTTAKLMADLSVQAGIDRLVAWHPHSSQIHGFYGATPVNLLSSLSLFIKEFEEFRNRDDVIAVAPDAGASKFVTHFGRELNINSAIASKYRPKPEEVITTEIIGNFREKKVAIILDDLISSAGTIYSLIQKLVKDKEIEQIFLGVSHNLCSEKALNRLQELHDENYLERAVFTNSIPQKKSFRDLPFVDICCLSDELSRTINRIHYSSSVSEIFYQA
ncbi:ribose-phosphate diphosphokinase [candidate division KSB1 bacterium]|nr:ribose-phosphate diphosphokinase [candidate division KSB1 bacterium]